MDNATHSSERNPGVEKTLEQARRDTPANWRHELRSPLNAMIGYSEMLLEDAREPEQKVLLVQLGKIHAAAKQLLASLNTVLDPLTIETMPDPVDLVFLSTHLCRALQPPLNTILQACQILIKDAETSHEWNSFPELRKIGTAAEHFMALVKEIMCPVESGMNEDASIISVFAKSPALEETMKSLHTLEMKDSIVSGGGLLLVVDDKEMNRDVLSRHLERQGHQVMIAEHGRQALEMLAEQTFDLMLLDIVMPEMNGFQVLQQLKEFGRLYDLPVIMISALDEMESVSRCIEMGAEDFLTKPFDPILLKARISACLEKKRLRDLAAEHFQDIVRLETETACENATFIRLMAQKCRIPVTASKMMADLLACYPSDNPKIAQIPQKISAQMDILLKLISRLEESQEVPHGKDSTD